MVQSLMSTIWPTFLLGQSRLPLGLFDQAVGLQSNDASSSDIHRAGGKCSRPLDDAIVNQLIRLSIVPALVFLFLALVRYVRLYREAVKVQPGVILSAKLVITA